MYQFLESIKLSDGVFCNLPLHQQRVTYSLQSTYNSFQRLNLNEVLHASVAPKTGVYKCRLLYNDSSYRLEYVPYHRKAVKKLKLVVADSLDYALKYADRFHLEQLLATRGDCDDVLVVKNGFITDCSYANVVFKRKREWVTPSTPLLNGVMRQHLLQEGIIKEATIYADEIAGFESCKLINALLELDGPEIEVDHIVY